MSRNLVVLGVTAALFGYAQAATAAEKDNDPLWVGMIGVAGEWAVPGGDFSTGPSLSVEFNVIKDWLEIEIGGAKLFRGSNWQFENEVVFRKPFTLSEMTEMMVGLGPMWSKAKGQNGKVGTTFVADFMFWSSPEKKYGWFLEPSYSLSPGNERSFAVNFGVLFGFH